MSVLSLSYTKKVMSE